MAAESKEISMASGPNAAAVTADTKVLQDVLNAIGASDLVRASTVADAALKGGMRHPALFNARALWAQQQNRHQDALEDFTRALAYAPRNVAILNAIGLCLVRLNRAQEAVATFDAAIELAPMTAEIHYRKGWAYDAMSDQAGAKQSYERAIVLRPNYSEALSGLAVIAAREGNAKQARLFAERATRSDAAEPTAAIALAIADISEKSFAAAEQRLKAALAGPRAAGHTRAVMLGFLADALDGQDRIAEAFAAYTEKNEEHRKLHEAGFAGRRRSVELLDQLAADLAATTAADWKPSEPEPAGRNSPREHVFLLGFLRSGTTLLEQVLATHPDIAALEERETFADLAPAFLSDKAGLSRLAALSGNELRLTRDTYWKRVREYGADPSGKVFID